MYCTVIIIECIVTTVVCTATCGSVFYCYATIVNSDTTYKNENQNAMSKVNTKKRNSKTSKKKVAQDAENKERGVCKSENKNNSVLE